MLIEHGLTTVPISNIRESTVLGVLQVSRPTGVPRWCTDIRSKISYRVLAKTAFEHFENRPVHFVIIILVVLKIKLFPICRCLAIARWIQKSADDGTISHSVSQKFPSSDLKYAPICSHSCLIFEINLLRKLSHPFQNIVAEVPLHTNFGGEVLSAYDNIWQYNAIWQLQYGIDYCNTILRIAYC